jgi:hypothetical protein
MIFTIRRWSHTRHGFEAVLKTVEVDDEIWATLQRWAIANREALLNARGKEALDTICESQNLLWETFPMEYRTQGDLADAVVHYFTLIQDNPMMIPVPLDQSEPAPCQ